MGYAEEIYDRAERQFSDIDMAISWLNSFERPARGSNAYTKAGVKVRDELSEIYNLRNKVETEQDFDSLKQLKKEVESLKFKDKDTISRIDEKMKKIGDELSELTKQRREAREEAERIRKEEERMAREIQKEVEKREAIINNAISRGEDAEKVVAKYEREIERLRSKDKRKRENAKRTLDKLKKRGLI